MARLAGGLQRPLYFESAAWAKRERFVAVDWLSVDLWEGNLLKQNGPRAVDPLKEAEMQGLIYWIVVGLIAGWLAGKVMKGGGYGILIDIVLGILGGVLGGWLFGMLGISAGGGLIGGIIVAFVGAVILVWITRLLKRA